MQPTTLPEPLNHTYDPIKPLTQHHGKQTWLAQNKLSRKKVVIKLLYFDTTFDWQKLKLFEREAQILQTLHYPTIPKYVDYVELQDQSRQGFGLVQSYVDGISLAEYLEKGRSFSEPDLKQLARRLLETLIFLHGRQPSVIHRDLKPSNIILADRSAHSLGEVYLIDFGAVQTLVGSTGSTRTVVGTYGYMPPEQFGGRTVPASDLYSLGATLVGIATGQHPADLPQENLRIKFEPLVQMSPALVRWLSKLIEPSLELRFSSAAAALAALDQPETMVEKDVKLTKPRQSRVILRKDRETFQLFIPPGGFHPALLILIPFAIAWNSFITFWTFTSISIPFPVNIVFLLFSLPFWTAGIGMVGGILLPLFGRFRLEINQYQIIQTIELLGVRVRWPKPSRAQDIDSIEFIERHWKKDSDGDRVEEPASLIIWVGTRKYQLGKSLMLQEPELKWLAQELSHWLSLPITHRNP